MPPEPDETALLLEALRDNGRESFSTLATRFGLSRGVVTKTVQRAIEAGQTRITASVNPDLMGFHRIALIRVGVTGSVQPVLALLKEHPCSSFVSETTGDFAATAEIRVTDDAELQRVTGLIRNLPSVDRVQTNLYDRIEVNRYSPVSTGKIDMKIDAIDHAIIAQLERDGRSTYPEIGAAAGISAGTARNRVQQLIQHGAIKVVALPIRGRNERTNVVGIGLHVAGSLDEAIHDFRMYGIEFLARAFGQFNVIVTVPGETQDDLSQNLDKFRAHPQVRALTTWAHLRIIKERYSSLTAGALLARQPTATATATATATPTDQLPQEERPAAASRPQFS